MTCTMRICNFYQKEETYGSEKIMNSLFVTVLIVLILPTGIKDVLFLV